MTPRERVMTAFAHRQPDRVPLGYLANKEIDRGLKHHYGLGADDNEALAQLLGVDFRGAWPEYIGPKLHRNTDIDVRVNEWGVRTRWIEHGAGGYWDYCQFPLAGALTVSQVEQWPMPNPKDYNYGALYGFYQAYEGYALVYGGAGVGCMLNRAGQLRSMQDVLCDVTTEDPAGLRLIERINDTDLEVVQRGLAKIGAMADIFAMGEDLGTQTGPIINPDTFRRVLRPRQQRFIDEAKKHGLLVMYHTCGASSWAFDDLIDMGVDIIDACQPDAAGMDPAELKRRWGNRLSFHGMVSTAEPLTHGTVEDVRDAVRRLLDVMTPGGGFALAPANLIQSNTPPENVAAMYETAREYGSGRAFPLAPTSE